MEHDKFLPNNILILFMTRLLEEKNENLSVLYNFECRLFFLTKFQVLKFGNQMDVKGIDDQ